MITLESAKCVSANLNALNRAADLVTDKTERGLLLTKLAALGANLYAVFYDVLPTIGGQKQWPRIEAGDFWFLYGRQVPFNEDELS